MSAEQSQQYRLVPSTQLQSYVVTRRRRRKKYSCIIIIIESSSGGGGGSGRGTRTIGHVPRDATISND